MRFPAASCSPSPPSAALGLSSVRATPASLISSAARRSRLSGSLLKLQPAHHTGHNPAGGWAIVALLGLGILTGLSGWAIYNDIGGTAGGLA
jgi:cytochrome b